MALDFKRLLYNPAEKVFAVLGNNYAQTFLATGELGKGFAVLSDKRVYFKGNCLVRNGKKFYTKQEEKTVDIRDVTGTGFIYKNALWAKIVYIILACTFVLFCFLTLITYDYGIPTFPILCIISAVLFLIFLLIYKANTYSLFEIAYAGGSIAFNLRWIDAEQSKFFQKQLNLLKDWQKSVSVPPATASPPDAEQLVTYKMLLDQGIITQEEFETKKKQLLGL